MRSTVVTAAVLGALFGGAAGWLAGSANAPTVARDDGPVAAAADANRVGGAQALTTRMERLERAVDRLTTALDRLPERTAASPAPPEDLPDGDATPRRPGRAAPPSDAAQRPSRAGAWEQIATDDLEMEADERHGGGTDSSGAVQRYRALLARGGTPAQVRRWSLRLGDSLIRLGRQEAACAAYQTAYEGAAQDEEGERLTALRGLFLNAKPERALAWIDDALRSGTFPENAMDLHQMAADAASNAKMPDRQRAELTWLIENRATWEPKFGWKKMLANLDAR